MKIIHLSDLHFGTETDDLVNLTLEHIREAKADFVIISGDFTQIGNKPEFVAARQFIDDIILPTLCIPGNHDVPQRNLYERFTRPYKKYKAHICDDLMPTYNNDLVELIGINSARRALPHWNWANGAVSLQQRSALESFFKDTPAEKWRICTMHHPIHKIADMPIDVTVLGRKRTLECFHTLKVDLVLTGHVHHAAFDMIGDEQHKTAFISASTALSSRKRGHENGFNIIEIDGQHMHVRMLNFEAQGFVETSTHSFRKSSSI
ncbi:MAG: metallophosphoesterase [Alphaproteobacteria bacterium]|nr:metallophosphoesterase [Alphaproteobacteria bacterium]